MIQKVNLKDLITLRKLSIQTFDESFSAMNTADNMKLYFENCLNTAKLEQELSNPDSHFYFFVSKGKPIAYLKLNTQSAQTENMGDEALELERIYVLKSAQGMKIGQQLLDFALNVGRQEQKKIIWLGVWEKNRKAIDFYLKNGFQHVDQHQFMVGTDLQIDYLFRKKL